MAGFGTSIHREYEDSRSYVRSDVIDAMSKPMGTQPVIRAIGVSHTACKDEVRHNPRSHSWWSVFSFFVVSCKSPSLKNKMFL